jgi:hypothetical protein
MYQNADNLQEIDQQIDLWMHLVYCVQPLVERQEHQLPHPLIPDHELSGIQKVITPDTKESKPEVAFTFHVIRLGGKYHRSQ